MGVRSSVKNIDLEIDELVIEGASSHRGKHIAGVLKKELERLFSEKEAAQALLHERGIRELNAEIPNRSYGWDSNNIGIDAARAIYESMKNG